MDKNQLLYKIFKPLDQFISGKSEGQMLSVGDDAPDFNVQDQDGKQTSLQTYAGKTIVLWFYPKADTPGCTAEACGFRDRIPAITGKNVQVLGVSFDTVAENKAFAQKFNLTFPLLCDTQRDIGLKYGACKSKEDKSASRIAYVISPERKIQHAFPRVNAATFPEEVSKLL